MNTKQASALSDAIRGMMFACARTEIEEYNGRVNGGIINVQWAEELRRAELRLQHVLLDTEILRPQEPEMQVPKDYLPSKVLLHAIEHMMSSVKFCDEALAMWGQQVEMGHEIRSGIVIDWLVDWLQRLQQSRKAGVI